LCAGRVRTWQRMLCTLSGPQAQDRHAASALASSAIVAAMMAYDTRNCSLLPSAARLKDPPFPQYQSSQPCNQFSSHGSTRPVLVCVCSARMCGGACRVDAGPACTAQADERKVAPCEWLPFRCCINRSCRLFNFTYSVVQEQRDLLDSKSLSTAVFEVTENTRHASM
jgi:hypothetical protein